MGIGEIVFGIAIIMIILWKVGITKQTFVKKSKEGNKKPFFNFPSLNLIMPTVLAVMLYLTFLFIIVRNQFPNFWNNWYGHDGSLFWGSNAIFFLSIWLRVRYYWYGATWVAIATGIIIISTCVPWA